MAWLLELTLIVISIVYLCNGETAKQKKPRLTVVSIDQCKLGNKRQDTENEVKYSVQARKVSRQTTLIKTSFDIPKKFGPITFTLLGYQLQQNNVRGVVLKMDKMECHNILPQEFVKVLKIKFDKDCNALPNHYEVDNINVQDHVKIFSQSLSESGKYAFDLEFWSPKGVVACVSFTINYFSG